MATSVLALLLIGLMMVVGSSLSSTQKIILMIIALALFILPRIGSVFYTSANKKLSAGTEERIKEAMKLYVKAIRFGLPDNYLITAGSILIQNGCIAEGINALEKVIGNKKQEMKLIGPAKAALSMAYWQEKQLDKAIAICEEVMASDYRDANLYINLSTYYLEKGDTEAFHKLAKEFCEKEAMMKAPALVQLKSTDTILHEKNWAKASKDLEAMLDGGREYRFADPYVLYALTRMYYGKRDEAISILERCLGNNSFANLAIIKKDMIVKLLENLKDDDKALLQMTSAVNDPLSIINGKLPELAEIAMVFPEEKKKESSKKIAHAMSEDINTDINEEDEEWLRKHNL